MGLGGLDLSRAQTPMTERDAVQRGENLREWKEEARRAETPLEPPARIGSIGSGGVNGFGFLPASQKVNPVKIDAPAGAPALFDPKYPLMTPGRPWWERERFKHRVLAATPRGASSRPLSPVPFGSMPHVAAIQNDGRLSEVDAFQARRTELANASPRTLQRELLREMLVKHEAEEVPREVALGPDYFGVDRDGALDKIMSRLDDAYRGNFPLMYRHMLDKDFATKIASSSLVRRSIRPRDMYAAPPHHPDAMDGYETHRRKHEDTMNRLYGPTSGRVHSLPDRPDTWLRRDGLKAGIPGIQSFTFYAHELQNAGYGAP